MKNYFDHKTKVKFIDGILEKSTDWQWIIGIMERDFDFKPVNSWSEFLVNYRNLGDVYSCLLRIHSLSDINIGITFSKKWLENIDLIARMYNEKMAVDKVWSLLDDSFAKLLFLMSYTARLQNLNNDKKFICAFHLFTQSNIFNQYDLSSIVEDEERILGFLKQIEFSEQRQFISTFTRNITHELTPANTRLLEEFQENILQPDAFSFQILDLPANISWEEKSLFDMLHVKFSNREIVPFIQSSEVLDLDLSLWKKKTLLGLKDYFNDFRATFIIETIDYMLNKTVPSETTIQWHFELTIKKLKNLGVDVDYSEIDCSSLQILSYMLHDNILPSDIKSKYMPLFSRELYKFTDAYSIDELKLLGLPISSQQKEISAVFHNEKANQIYNVSESHHFADYCQDKDVYLGITDEHIEKATSIFNTIVHEKDGVTIAYVFYHFMQLLLNLSQNKNVNQRMVKSLMIALKKSWREHYYNKCVSGMQYFEKGFSVLTEEIEKLNDAIISDPLQMAFLCFQLNREKILQKMETVSSHALLALVQNFEIDEDYPIIRTIKLDRNHTIDSAFLDIIKRIIERKGYKLLNRLKDEEFINGIYQDYMRMLPINVSLFSEYNKIYNKIKSNIKEYKLINLVDDKVTVAHITQLFPILEMKIREYGAALGIVPFKESVEEFYHVKDASSVLTNILMEIYEETGDFERGADLFFIYQCMYNGNMFNIRNECAHGNKYLRRPELNFAFKVTLLSLSMILKRLDTIKIYTKNQ